MKLHGRCCGGGGVRIPCGPAADLTAGGFRQPRFSNNLTQKCVPRIKEGGLKMRWRELELTFAGAFVCALASTGLNASRGQQEEKSDKCKFICRIIQSTPKST